MPLKYASLHNHTSYSNLKLIDSINKVEDLIDYGIILKPELKLIKGIKTN